MAKEIERKFLVTDTSYRQMSAVRHAIRQGYLSVRKESTVRVRIKDDAAFITVKGITTGATRDEWEYPIPTKDAEDMLIGLSCGKIIDKTRFIVHHEGHTWEVDEFHGCHDGLVIAEIELESENETFSLPGFVGKEVTGDAAYYNSSLAGI